MNVVKSELACALRGPIVMITIGMLFLLDRFTGLHFGETWPLILIVLGVLALMGAGRRRPGFPTDMPSAYPPNYASNYPPGYSAPYSNVPPAGPPPNASSPNAPPPNAPPSGVRR